MCTSEFGAWNDLSLPNVAEMFDVFGSVKGLIKLDSICIDNNVFRLHYKATFIVLVVCSLLVTSKQYIGDPIDCIVEEIPNNVMVGKLILLKLGK